MRAFIFAAVLAHAVATLTNVSQSANPAFHMAANGDHTYPLHHTSFHESASRPGDPRCERGIANRFGEVCCPRSCLRCDSQMDRNATHNAAQEVPCEESPGGAGDCCKANILQLGRSCNTHEAPCEVDEALHRSWTASGPPPPHLGYSGGDKGSTAWQVPTLAPPTPGQEDLAAPALAPADSERTGSFEKSCTPQIQTEENPYSGIRSDTAGTFGMPAQPGNVLANRRSAGTAGIDTAACAEPQQNSIRAAVATAHPRPADGPSADVQETWTATLGSVFPHSEKDTSTHGAQSGFHVHTGQINKCGFVYYTNQTPAPPPPCSPNLAEMAGAACPPWASRSIPLQGECAPPGPMYRWTSQTPASISAGSESTGGVYASWPQPGLGTVDTGGALSPGHITSGNNRRAP